MKPSSEYMTIKEWQNDSYASSGLEFVYFIDIQ